jgi:type I restriction enzyme S subunit
VRALGEIFKLTSGKTKPLDLSETAIGNKSLPVYGGNGIIGFSSEFNSEGEKIIIGRVGEYCGITRYINEKCWITDNALITKDFLIDIDILFLTYKLQQEDISKLRSKGGQPLVSQAPIYMHKVVLPKYIPEQTAIANLLSTWDKAIETNQKLIAQKELRKKWLMQVLLTGEKRVKGFNREWKEHHLNDMFSERNEIRYNHLQLLSVGQNGIYLQTESEKRDISNEDKSKYKRICPGDIGYNTMRMWQGRSALSTYEGIVSPAYTILKPTQNANPFFFSYLFKTKKLMNLFWRHSQGLVEDTLNCRYKDFSKIKVRLPEKKEQNIISEILLSTDKEIQLLQIKLVKLKEQKKGLMQVLLTGKKRLKIY